MNRISWNSQHLHRSARHPLLLLDQKLISLVNTSEQSVGHLGHSLWCHASSHTLPGLLSFPIHFQYFVDKTFLDFFKGQFLWNEGECLTSSPLVPTYLPIAAEVFSPKFCFALTKSMVGNILLTWNMFFVFIGKQESWKYLVIMREGWRKPKSIIPYYLTYF